MDLSPSLLLAVASGVVIAATCGLRAFLPLLAIGIAARFFGLPLHEAARWLAHDAALVALALATVLEIAGDKIPVVDHVLDSVGLVVRPLAAAFGSFAVLQGVPAPWGPMIAVVLGGLALGVQGVKATTRVGSTAATAGAANPLLSVAEDVAALVGVILAFLAPLLAAIGIVVLLGWLAGRGAGRQAGSSRA